MTTTLRLPTGTGSHARPAGRRRPAPGHREQVKAGLQQWQDPRAKGGRRRAATIGDGGTGTEHLRAAGTGSTTTWCLDPRPPRVASSTESHAGRDADAGGGHVHRSRRHAPTPTVPDIGGTAHAVAHPQQPLLHARAHRRRGTPSGRSWASPRRTAPAAGVTACPTPRCCTCGSSTTLRGPFSSLEGVGAGQAVVETQDPNANPDCQHSTAPPGGRWSGGSRRPPRSGARRWDAGPCRGPPRPGAHDGVTPEQQAAADQLLADTKAGLWQWHGRSQVPPPGSAPSATACTGTEHLVNWNWINDDVVLDPNRPESLVYRVDDRRAGCSKRPCTSSGGHARRRGARRRRHAHPVAHPQQPLLQARAHRRRAPPAAPSSASPTRTGPAAGDRCPTPRCCTCGSSTSPAARSPASRASAPARPSRRRRIPRPTRLPAQHGPPGEAVAPGVPPVTCRHQPPVT